MRRRTFLLAGLGTGGALVFGWSLTPPRQRLHGHTRPSTEGGAIALNGWLMIAPDDTVTVVSPKAEMGQGIHTALAMLIAEELSCDWTKVRTVHSPVDRIYNNIAAIVDGLPIHSDLDDHLAVRGVRWLTAKMMREVGVMMTGGSSSVRDCWTIARQAGATAREALVLAASARSGVPVADCRVQSGVVICGRQRFRFGELVADAATQRPTEVRLKAPSEFQLIGKPMPRLDAGDKARGTATFGIDVRPAGVRYAAVAMAPAADMKPVSFDEAAARARAGVLDVVPLAGSPFGDRPGVAVIADSWWRAKQALAAMPISWSPTGHTQLSDTTITAKLLTAVSREGGLPFRSVGEGREVLTGASRVLEATYEAPYLAHATMEPMNATVLVENKAVTVWTGTQVPGFARKAAATIAGVDEEQVTLHQQLLGGGFGRRLDVDYIAQATAVAKAMPGVPIQLIWSREDDFRHDFYRPAAVSHLRAAINGGALAGIVARSASQAPFREYSKRVGLVFTTAGPDRTTAEGTWDQPYEIPSLHVTHADVELPIPVGSWRSVGHSHQAFFYESFLDEIAAALKTDPLRFRLGLLERHTRAARVLRMAADRAGWSEAPGEAPDGQPIARGVALHFSFGTLVAHVADVSISPAREIRVHRIVCAVDCGLVVNPDGAAQQVEGAILDGLGTALHGALRIEQGQVTTRNFDGSRPLRLPEVPRLEVHFVPSTDTPTGLGEPALPGVAPAVANAVFRLTGYRLRALPLRLPPEPI